MKFLKKLKKGASLIELMVAIVILSLVLSQSFFMQLGAVKLVEGSNRAEIASELAQEKIDEYRGVPGEAIVSETKSKIEVFDGHEYTRTWTITSYGSSVNTKKIVVKVEWDQAGWVRNIEREGVLR